MTAPENIVAQHCQYCASNCPVEYGYCHCGCGRRTNLCPRSDRPRQWIKGNPQKFFKGHTDKERKRNSLPFGQCICGRINCPIPYGYCHCTCGQKTPIVGQTSIANRRIAGEPARFVFGHGPRITPEIEEAEPFKIEGVYCRLIPLTQGQYTIVWASDYEWLMQWKWYAERRPDTGMFYAARSETVDSGKKVNIYIHRQILGLKQGDSKEVDHVYSHNTLDNRRSNLRVTDNYGQAQNTGKKRFNTSGYKGVSWDKEKRRWIAQIVANGNYKFLGYYDTKEEAYAAYCEAAKMYHGEFARLA